jgi:hypothetical protein
MLGLIYASEHYHLNGKNMTNSEDSIEIDPGAKLIVPLEQKDCDDGLFYLGKLQFNGTFDFETGMSFMIFTAEEGGEELHIGPLDPKRLHGSNVHGAVNLGNGLKIDLRPLKDRTLNTYHVGEAIAPATLNMRKGVAFSIFLNVDENGGKRSHMEISRLIIRPRKKDF